jgi:mycothiol synthase
MGKFQQLNVGGLTIDSVDLRSLTEEQTVAVTAFSNILRAESVPEDPPRPVELTRAHLQNIPTWVDFRTFWGLDADGAIAASAECSWTTLPENKHLLEFGISVRPDMRQRGIGKALLALIADVSDEQNRPLLTGGTSESVPAGEIFAQKVGAEARLSQHTNRLLLSDVDRAMVDAWVADGPKRAEGYSLITFDGPYPDSDVEALVELAHVMNTAPREDLDMEDFNFTVEQERDWEKAMLAAGDQRWTMVTRHDATGQFAGFTETFWNPKMPKVVHQAGTGVLPEHRGHALGKWLKAAMLARVMDERTEASEIRTGNADSNDAMLGINKQLGFKPFRAHKVWQVPVEKVRAYLGSNV